MASLVQDRKIRYLGLSEVLSACRGLDIGFVAYSPLGRGFLTGRLRSMAELPDDDYRRTTPRFQNEDFQKNLSLLAPTSEIAKEKSCLPSQVALPWVLGQGKEILRQSAGTHP